MKKYLILLLTILSYCSVVIGQSVGINGDGSQPDNRAILDIKSTSKGVLFPTLTDAERDALYQDVPEGLIIYNSTTQQLQLFFENKWYPLKIGNGENAMPMDGDGNMYNTVQIGTQTWLKENLKTTKYNDGTPIGTDFSGTAPAYAFYNNNEASYKSVYGALYNWYAIDAASNGNKNVCPVGWHVSSDDEWTTLTTYLGGESIAGGKLKETGTTHWNSPNTGSTNNSCFTALPAGEFLLNSGFWALGNFGYFWCSTQKNATEAWIRYLACNDASNHCTTSYKYHSFSVRCVKNAETTGGLPTLTTTNLTAIAENTATSGGAISSDGGATITARGVCWNTSPNPTITNSKTNDGSGTGSFTSSITGLNGGTLYYVRAYATNSYGTAYGEEKIFTTLNVPTISTTAINSIMQNNGTSGGVISSDGGATITSRGVCWSTSPNPTITNSKTNDGSGTGSFTSSITGLNGGTLYYVRAYATNSVGTAYGEQVSFTTLTAPTAITDGDGNTYTSVVIGTQVWLKENLKTTKYNDGTPITLITNTASWSTAGAAYCWYNNDEATYKSTHGALYNWHVINTATNGNKNVCPVGYQIPTDAEWKTMEMYLGMTQTQADGTAHRGTDQGNKIKEAGNANWLSPSTGTNTSGFTALPSGMAYTTGVSMNVGQNAFWWSSTNNGTSAYSRVLFYNYTTIYRTAHSKELGFSIRCIKK